MAKRQLSTGITDLGGGRYRIRVPAGYHPVTGARMMFDKSIRDATDDDAELIRAGFILQRGEIPDMKDLTVHAFFTGIYFPYLERRLAAGDRMRRTTLSDYRAKYRLHVEPYFATVKLAKLSSLMLKEWMLELATLPRFGQKSQHHMFNLVHGALSFAVEAEILKKNPLKRAYDPGEPKKKQKVYTAEQANALLDFMRGHPLEATALTAFSCWLRRSELAALEWSDFAFWTETATIDGVPVEIDCGSVTIWRGLHQDKTGVWFEPPKNEESKTTLPLPKGAVCRRLRQLRGIGPLSSENGTHMKPDTLSYRLRRATKLAGLPTLSVKNWRHTGITLAIEAHVDLKAVSERARHTAVRTTETIYVNTGTEYAQMTADAGVSWLATQPDTKAISTQSDAQNRGKSKKIVGR